MARGDHSPEERAHRQNCRFYVACPFCGAAAGEKCKGVRGQKRAANHVERWQLFDPAHVAAKAPRKEKLMARIPDVFDYDDAMEQGADPQPVTCRHCGVGDLHWQRVIRADGRSEVSRLFDDRMRPHVCKPNPHDFD